MARKKFKLDPFLVILGVISGVFATLSIMCIPCILAANPSIALFFAFLGTLSILLAPYSWLFLILGVLFLAAGITLQLAGRKKKCR